jgi:hypothetical protein
MRLIDATRLVKLALLERDKIPLTIVERYSFGTQSPNRHGQSMHGGIRKILRLIEQAPTIDAVPVVRCRDCKYAFQNNGHDKEGCPIMDRRVWMDGNSFCSEGKQMDGEPHD